MDEFAEESRLLIVDDEPQIRRVLRRLLEGRGYPCDEAGDVAEARARLRERPCALVLTDMNMPGESGLHLVRHVIRECPGTAVIMITAVDDVDLAQAALDLGAYGYIIKPFEMNEIVIGISNALRRRRLEGENRGHVDRLEQRVVERTRTLAEAMRKLERTREETIGRLATAAEFRHDETARHIQRMSLYCALIVRGLGGGEEGAELIRIASPMHDIGKLGTPDHILLKPGKLTAEEFEVMKRHAEMGHRILDGSDSDLLAAAARIAWTHHEKFDGSGYPRGLTGEAIPLEGRIAAVADVFDALTSRRVYKPALPFEEAVGILREGRGRHFDPAPVDVFLGAEAEVRRIMERHADRL